MSWTANACREVIYTTSDLCIFAYQSHTTNYFINKTNRPVHFEHYYVREQVLRIVFVSSWNVFFLFSKFCSLCLDCVFIRNSRNSVVSSERGSWSSRTSFASDRWCRIWNMNNWLAAFYTYNFFISFFFPFRKENRSTHTMRTSMWVFEIVWSNEKEKYRLQFMCLFFCLWRREKKNCGVVCKCKWLWAHVRSSMIVFHPERTVQTRKKTQWQINAINLL